MSALINRAGQRFGRLVAVELTVERDKHRQAFWLCRCDCGAVVKVRSGNLRKGHARSCGCLKAEVSRETVKAARAVGHARHGHSAGGVTTPEYRSWAGMWDRCRNAARPDFHRYGGRGITVCERWQYFGGFLADMGARPGAGYSLDRIDNEQGYRPDNCRWATAKQQANNRRPRTRRAA